MTQLGGGVTLSGIEALGFIVFLKKE